MIFNKVVLSICLTFVSVYHAFSFDQTFHQKLSGGAIQQNAVIEVEDPVGSEDLSATYGAVVELSYGKELIGLNSNPWDVTIDYSIITYNAEGIETEVSGEQLMINYGTSAPQIISFKKYDLENDQVSIRIDNVTGQFPDDVDVKLYLTKQAEIETTVNDHVGALGYDSQQKLLYWTYFPGASSYEIDWVYKDQYSEKYETPVTVTSDNNYLPWQILHEAGDVFFRVRPLYEYQGGYLKGAYTFSSTPLVINENQSFESDKNWSCVLTYLEDGRFKQAVEYSDGQGRVRQSTVNVQSQKLTSVKEVKYDSEGRVALDILPMPLEQIDGTNPFQFQSSLNTFDGVEDITAFDQGAGSLPLTTTSGTSKYYSSNNDMSFPARDYVPDAEGYPFVQYEFKKDGTGRMVRQSNVGDELRLHNGASEDQHYSSYLYGTPKAAELNRLFGTNVGKPQNYQKTVAIDPNGQMSVSYIDGNGQTIATALAGEKPSNLNAIASYPESPRGLGSPLITNDDALTDGIHRSSVNIMMNLKKNSGYTFNYTLDGIINHFDPCVTMQQNMLEDLAPGGELYNEAFLNHVDYAAVNLTGLGANPEVVILDEQNYQDTWAVALLSAHPLYADYQTCLSTASPICNECVYDLEIKVIDPDGIVLSPIITHTFDASELADKCSTTLHTESIPSQDYTFGKIGEYTVVKTLTLSDGAIDALIMRLEQEKPEGFPDLEDIKASYLANVDYSSCAETCEDRCRFELLAGGFTDGTSDFNDAYDDCVSLTCNDDDLLKEGEQMECDNLLTAMRNQIKPGGFWNASLSGKQALIDGMELPGIGSNRIADLQSAAHWNDFWLEELVPRLDFNGSEPAYHGILSQQGVHPEYHHYKACVLEVDAKVYESRLFEISSWEEAVASGYVNPTGTNPNYIQPPQLDPFYSQLLPAAYGQLMASKMNVFKTTIDVNGDGSLNQSDILSIWGFAQLNIAEGQTATTSEGKWRLFTGSYLNLRRDMREGLMTALTGCGTPGCIYLDPADYRDENNDEIPGVVLVPGPPSYPTDRTGAQTLNDNQIAANCAANSGTLAESWITRLEGCSGVVLNGSEVSILQMAFENYFLAHCGYSNPVNILAREDISTDSDLQTVLGVNPAFEECLYNMAVSRGAAYRENCEIIVEPQDNNEYLNLMDQLLSEFENLVEENPGNSLYELQAGDPIVEQWRNTLGPNGMNWTLGGYSWGDIVRFQHRPNDVNFLIEAVISGYSGSWGVVFYTNPFTLEKSGQLLDVQDYSTIESMCPFTSGGHRGRGILNLLQENDDLIEVYYRFNSENILPFQGCVESTHCVIESNNECGCMDDALYSLSAQNGSSSDGSTHFQSSGLSWGIVYNVDEHLEIVKRSYNSFLSHMHASEDGRGYVMFGRESEYPHITNFESQVEFFGFELNSNWRFMPQNNNRIVGFAYSPSEVRILYKGQSPNAITHSSALVWHVVLDDLTEQRIPLIEVTEIKSFDQEQVLIKGGFQYIKAQATVNDVEQEVWIMYLEEQGEQISSCKKSGYDQLTLNTDHLRMRKETSGDLMNIYVYDETGNPFVFDDLNNSVVTISVPDYVHTSPVSNEPGNLFYSHYQVLVEYQIGDATEVEAGYLYVDNAADLNEPFFNECFVEQPALVTIDPFTLCADNKEREAEVLAQQVYEIELANYLTNYLNESVNNCFKRPYNEHFTYSSNVKEYHYTLYYYDQAGDLIQTVPPEGVKPVAVSLSDYDSEDNYIGLEPDHGLQTKYKYDGLGNLVRKFTPDGGAVNYWYDSKFRMRLSQNAKQKVNGQFAYTSYDDNNRLVEVGQLESFDFTYTQLMDPVVFENQIKPVISQNNWPLLTALTRTEITTTYYDQAGEGVQMVLNNTRNSVAQVVTKEQVNDPTSNYYAYSYSTQGVLTDLEQQIPGLGKKHTSYDYDVISGNVNEVTYQKGEIDQIIHRYGYDEDNRLKSVETSTDGWVWQEEVNYSYYPHGPLARVELGDDKVQGLDYLYTLQGWIKGVNTPQLSANHITRFDPGHDGISGVTASVAQDEFAYALSFYKNDYSPIGNANLGVGSSINMFHELGGPANGVLEEGLYNGNITAMATQVKSMGEVLGLDGLTADAKGLNMSQYQHDQLNRLSKSSTYHDASQSAWKSTGMFANNSSYTYDGNGNILHLTRNNQGSLMDDLSYDFDYGVNDYGENILLKNTLNHVTELPSLDLANVDDITDQSSFNNGQNYGYDDLGNLISDASEGIESIEWTLSGKVRSITREAGSTDDDLEFVYDAMDNRVAKVVKPQAAQDESDYEVSYYSMDAEGTVIANYKRGQNEQIILTEQPIYGGERVGLITRNIPLGAVVKHDVQTLNYSFETSEAHILFGEVTTFTTDEANTGERSYKQVTQYGSKFRMPVERGDLIAELSVFGKMENPATGDRSNVVMNIKTEDNEILFAATGGAQSTWQNKVFNSSSDFEKLLFMNVSVPESLYTGDGSLYEGNIIVQASIVNPQAAANPIYIDDWYLRVEHDLSADDYYVQSTALGSEGNLTLQQRNYELKDHLGNVRAVVSDQKFMSSRVSANDVFSYSYEADEVNILNGTPEFTAALSASGSRSQIQNSQYGNAFVTEVFRGDVIVELSRSGRMENTSSTQLANMVLTLRSEYGIILHTAPDGASSTWQYRTFPSATEFQKKSFNNVVIPKNLYTPSGNLVTGRVFIQSNTVNPLYGENTAYFDDLYVEIDRVDNRSVEVYEADLVSCADYYPFGMEVPGSVYSDGYRYGFNGMEKDDEINGYSSHYRINDPRLAKWTSIDPKAELYPGESPYVSVGNNPIMNIDPKGDSYWHYLKGRIFHRTVFRIIKEGNAKRLAPMKPEDWYEGVPLVLKKLTRVQLEAFVIYRKLSKIPHSDSDDEWIQNTRERLDRMIDATKESNYLGIDFRFKTTDLKDMILEMSRRSKGYKGHFRALRQRNSVVFRAIKRQIRVTNKIERKADKASERDRRHNRMKKSNDFSLYGPGSNSSPKAKTKPRRTRSGKVKRSGGRSTKSKNQATGGTNRHNSGRKNKSK